MKNASANKLAIGLLLCGTIWMALRISGVFQVSPVQLPAWAGVLVALGFLAGPVLLIFPQSLHWVIRLGVAVVFVACAFVFPWFYDQFPIYFWVTMALVYVEVFGVPFLLKKKKKRLLDEESQTGNRLNP